MSPAHTALTPAKIVPRDEASVGSSHRAPKSTPSGIGGISSGSGGMFEEFSIGTISLHGLLGAGGGMYTLGFFLKKRRIGSRIGIVYEIVGIFFMSHIIAL